MPNVTRRNGPAPGTPESERAATPAGGRSPGETAAAPGEWSPKTKNKAPRPLRATAPLAQAAQLGTIEGTAVAVGPDGALTRAGQVKPDSLSERVRLARHTISRAKDVQPFAEVKDVAVLRAAAANAAELHSALLAAPQSEAQTLEFRSGRAAALGLMEAAARRAGALGDLEARDQLTLGMVFSLGREPHRPLRDFSFERLVSRAEVGELPPVESARTTLYPTKFPFDRWLKDGKVQITHYVDDDGSPRSGVLSFYEDKGFNRVDKPDGTTLLTRPGGRGVPTLQVTIPPTPPKDQPPALFEKMNDSGTDIIVYSGHAGYGKRVEDALSKGVGGTGEGKLVVLLQCYGEGSIELLNRSFPDAQLISARDSTTDNYDLLLLENVFEGIDRQSSTEAIEKETIKEFNQFVARSPWMAELAKKQPIERHYFFPHSRAVITSKVDRDRDGVRDASDALFNVVYPKRVDASGGLDPLDPGAPLDGLDGTALNAAAGQLNLVARYSVLPSDLLKQRVPWHGEMFEPRGFHEGSPDDLRAFKFGVDATGKRITVSLSSLFAHSPKEQLARMLAVEAAQFVGERALLDRTQTTTLSLSMLERVLHQEGSNVDAYDHLDVWAREAVEAAEGHFRKRYGLPVGFAAIQKASGDPADFVPRTYAALSTLVAKTPELASWSLRQPQRATVPVRVPANLALVGRHSRDDLQALVNRLGVRGTVALGAVSTGIWAHPKTMMSVPLETQGGRAMLNLGIDGEGVVRAAALVPGR